MLLQPVEECVVTQEWTASRGGMLRISVSPTNALLFPLQEGIWSTQSVRAPGEIGLVIMQTCISCSEYLSPLMLNLWLYPQAEATTKMDMTILQRRW